MAGVSYQVLALYEHSSHFEIQMHIDANLPGILGCGLRSTSMLHGFAILPEVSLVSTHSITSFATLLLEG